jgi:6-phosphogluconolactonase
MIVLPDSVAVAQAGAQRLAMFLLESQCLSSPVHVALTGGDTGIAVLSQLRANPLLDAISWPDIHFWWGDERFVAISSAQRNDLAARQALLDHLPQAPGGIHRIGSPDQGISLERAAQNYSAELRHHAVVFSLVLLGVGPDGHVASVFPGHGDGAGIELPGAFPVPDSPKPPPARISLTLDTINAANEVWLMAAGAAKAGSVAASVRPPAVRSAGAPRPIPAARVAGRERTVWLADAAAAARA